MIKNYFTVAWRNIKRNGFYSIINIGGLGIGMTVSFMLLIYACNELSFDSQYKNAGRIYQVMRNQPSNGIIATGTSIPAPAALAMAKDFPEIEKITRTSWPRNLLTTYKDKQIKLATLYVDSSFLDLFSYDVVYGDKAHPLQDPSSVVLTLSGAEELFGNENPVGQLVKLDNKSLMKVSAVVKDKPENSSFSFVKVFAPWHQLEAGNSALNTNWGNYSYFTYTLLKPGVSVASLNDKLKGFIGHYDPENKENKLFLYPFSRYHLHGDFKNGVNTGGAIEYVRLFLFMAIGILLIACVNFMNLSTARSERRAREVGIRKAIGAKRLTLIMQFLGESVLTAFASFVFALLLLLVLLPLFSALINIQLSIPFANVSAWLCALGLVILTGVIAGSYPAIFLSSFRPVKVLKGQIVSARSPLTPRKILVIFQFTFAIALILSSLFIYKQIQYIKSRPVGYDRKGLIEMPVEGNITAQFESFRQDLINAGAVTDAAMTASSVTNANSSSWGIIWHGQLPGEDKIPINQMNINYHFINTYGLKLIKGRDIAIDNPSDTNAIILNQAAVKFMRFKEPLGQIIKYHDKDCTVVGVVEDFVWGSPYEPVSPAIIAYYKHWVNNIGLRLNPSKPASESIRLVEGIYKKYNPEYPFQYKFVDEKFDAKFKTEKLLGTMSISFTALAIIISCLGLFGLALFSAEQRRKEIGVRKVLGASTTDLWLNLSTGFVKLVIISFFIGTLISLWYVTTWLDTFTYHTPLSIWIFFVTLVISLVICLSTVSWQAIKAALANPVKNLRTE
ncbi:MAG TPA: ABC transporter permease [Mucilaginibacter sp.]|nr:ABC transporter permease [Mucilaginibacter sp.]